MVKSELAANAGLTHEQMHRWQLRLDIVRRVALCFAMAALTGLLAQVRVPLPWTPVPLTGQVVAVLLAGALMGKRYGALSQILYVALGAAGVPWFAGWHSASLLGPTGGYILGFIPAAALVGWLIERRPTPGLGRCVMSMAAGVGVIHFAGALQFALILRTGLEAALTGAVLPFIPLDLAKALLAAALTLPLLPAARPGPAVPDTASQSCPGGGH
jgi:biotin transport system substrate-specific component